MASALLRQSRAPGFAVAADVRDGAQVAEAVARIRAEFGRLDILVNNVGDFVYGRKPFDQDTDAEWDALYAINLRHMFVVTRAALPLMRAGAAGGSIINISSIEACRGVPQRAVYGAFKTAIVGFTRSLALELGPDRIRVNTIAPETTETEQVRVSDWIAPENRDRIRGWVPLGRFGTVEDAAGSALFLASDLSGWVSGTTLNLDGGSLAAAGWMMLPDGRWTHRPVATDDGYSRRG